jgi:hypothetical protein
VVLRPLDCCGSTTHLLLRFGLCLKMLIGDQVGPLDKAEDRRLEMVGCVMWKVGTSKVVAHRLCRLRTDGLAPASKY